MKNRILSQLKETAFRQLIPISVQLNITNQCDLACRHCYIRSRNLEELSTSRIGQLIDDLEQLGTLFLTLSGGDVFFRPDIFDILQSISQKKFSVRILTNGYRIDPGLATALKKWNINEISISLYGATAQSHDAVTQTRGAFSRALRAIEILKAQQFKVLVSSLISQENRDQIPAIQELTERLGVPCQFDLTVTPIQGSCGVSELNLPCQEKAAALCRIEKNTRRPDFNTPREAILNDPPCLAGHISCNIFPEGTVTPCVDWPEVCGNLKSAPFPQIWQDSPVFKRIRQMKFQQYKGCDMCQYLSFCQPCPGISFQEKGDALSVSALVCQRSQSIFEALQMGESAK